MHVCSVSRVARCMWGDLIRCWEGYWKCLGRKADAVYGFDIHWYRRHIQGNSISPSGTSELACATTKTDTAEKSISISRESLQACVCVCVCTRRRGQLADFTARGQSWRNMAWPGNKKEFCVLEFAGLTSAASPRVDISSTCKVGLKLGVSLPLLTCSPWAWPSRLLYRRGQNSQRDLWITLYRLRCIKVGYVNWIWDDLLITWACMTHGIIHQPVTAKGRVRSQGILYEICGGLGSAWTGFSPSTSVSPRHCQSLICHWRYVTLWTDSVVT